MVVNRMEQHLTEQHRRIWRALDRLAAANGLSPSGLAKSAGLDATAFNPSKRVTRDGRLRWPGAETLAKVMAATGARLTDIAQLAGDPGAPSLPVRKLAATGELTETTERWAGLGVEDAAGVVLELETDVYAPILRRGDRLAISPNADLRAGDRVALSPAGGGLVLGLVQEIGPEQLALAPLSGEAAPTRWRRADVAWIGRVTAILC